MGEDAIPEPERRGVLDLIIFSIFPKLRRTFGYAKFHDRLHGRPILACRDVRRAAKRLANPAQPRRERLWPLADEVVAEGLDPFPRAAVDSP